MPRRNWGKHHKTTAQCLLCIFLRLDHFTSTFSLHMTSRTFLRWFKNWCFLQVTRFGAVEECETASKQLPRDICIRVQIEGWRTMWVVDTRWLLTWSACCQSARPLQRHLTKPWESTDRPARRTQQGTERHTRAKSFPTCTRLCWHSALAVNWSNAQKHDVCITAALIHHKTFKWVWNLSQRKSILHDLFSGGFYLEIACLLPMPRSD